MVIGPYIFIITLNVNGIKCKTKRHRLAEKMKTCAVCTSTYYIILLNPLVEEKVHSERKSCSVMSDSLQPHGLQPTRLLCPWDFPGKNTGVGCHFLFQGIFPTQGSNPGLPCCRQTLYHLSHQGSPKLYLIILYGQVNHVSIMAHNCNDLLFLLNQ